MPSNPRADYAFSRNELMRLLRAHIANREAYNALSDDISYYTRNNMVHNYEMSLYRINQERMFGERARQALLNSGLATDADRAMFEADAIADAPEIAIERMEDEHFRQVSRAGQRLMTATSDRMEAEIVQATRIANQSARELRERIEATRVTNVHKKAAIKEYEEMMGEVSGVKDLSLPTNIQSKIASYISGISGSATNQSAALGKHISAVKAAPLTHTNLLGNPLKQAGGKHRRKMSRTMRRKGRKGRKTQHRK